MALRHKSTSVKKNNNTYFNISMQYKSKLKFTLNYCVLSKKIQQMLQLNSIQKEMAVSSKKTEGNLTSHRCPHSNAFLGIWYSFEQGYGQFGLSVLPMDTN